MSQLLSTLKAVGAYLPEVFKAIKSAIFYASVRIFTKTRLENKVLKKEKAIHEEQLDIATQPHAPWAAILDRMRRGER